MQGTDVDMRDRSGCVFRLDAQDLRVFVASGLDGKVASTAAAVLATGLRVVGELDQAVLLTCANQHSHGLDLLHVQRWVQLVRLVIARV